MRDEDETTRVEFIRARCLESCVYCANFSSFSGIFLSFIYFLSFFLPCPLTFTFTMKMNDLGAPRTQLDIRVIIDDDATFHRVDRQTPDTINFNTRIPSHARSYFFQPFVRVKGEVLHYRCATLID